jgi:PAS domain S-box-containing protein
MVGRCAIADHVYVAGVEQIFGYSREELSLDHHIWKTFVLPEDHKILEHIEAEVMTGVTVNNTESPIENGTLKWLETTFTPALNDAGQLIK